MGSLVWSSSLKPDGRLSDRDSYVMFHPSDRRVPHMLIAKGDLPSIFVDNPGAYANSIFMACVKGTWSGSSKLPWGHNVRFVGEAGAIHAETKALLSQHGMWLPKSSLGTHGMVSECLPYTVSLLRIMLLSLCSSRVNSLEVWWQEVDNQT